MYVVTRRVDEWIAIGEGIHVSPTDIDPGGARFIVRGRMLGGAEDGAVFESAYELARGQSFHIGDLVIVTLLEVLGDKVRVGINCPKHLPVGRTQRGAGI